MWASQAFAGFTSLNHAGEAGAPSTWRLLSLHFPFPFFLCSPPPRSSIPALCPSPTSDLKTTEAVSLSDPPKVSNKKKLASPRTASFVARLTDA